MNTEAMMRKKGTSAKVCKSKKKSKKRKNKSKESPEEFVLPKKTARPDFPTKIPDPVKTSKYFSDLEQDVEQTISENTDTSEKTIDKPTSYYAKHKK
ncbi:hypothetical protein TNCV_3684361 [Trichonephila clavipes]|uniref:Uncharacterized protein n=1 Tax=Trichonephila clavipes TaxID=2585209 RepID=A0A8X6V6Y0_TRICX|nr:hypothetical protein TNCV_3684361 [Trichonephila clavipes]